jgi:DNA-binding transcriptional LysR family regulator
VIPDLAARLQERFPLTEFVVKGKHSVSLVRDITNGRMDAAFIGLHTLAPGLQVETLREEGLIVALPVNHRLARRRAIDFDDLKDEPLFWFERRANPGFYDHCAAFFEGIGFVPRLVPEPADHHILLAMIAEEKGLALIPASLRRISYQGVLYRPLKKDQQGLSMGIALAWLGSNPSPVLHAFLELARMAGADRPAPHTG